MARKKSKAGRSKPLLFFFALENCTLSPFWIEALSSIGCKVELIAMTEPDLGQVRLSNIDSFETILQMILRQKPDAIILINGKGYDDFHAWLSVAELLKIPVFNYYTDHPRFTPLRNVETIAQSLNIVLWDSAYVEEMEKLGFQNVQALPLAAAVQPIIEPEGGIPECDVAFVGSLGSHRISQMEHELLQIIDHEKKPTSEQAQEWIAKGCEWARANKGQSIFLYIEGIPSEELPEDVQAALQVRRLIATLIDFQNMRNDRIELIELLSEFNLKVWGDAGWRDHLSEEKFEGFLPYENAPAVYQKAKIVVNLSRDQLLATVNQRVFDVPAAGGFLITDWRRDLECFLDPENDVAVFHELKKLPELIKRYLKDDTLRKEMSEQAQSKILKDHSWKVRLQIIPEWIRDARKAKYENQVPLEDAWELRLERAVLALQTAKDLDSIHRIAEVLEKRGISSPSGGFIIALNLLHQSDENIPKATELLVEVCETASHNHARDLLAQVLDFQQRISEMEPYLTEIEEEKRTAKDWYWLGKAKQEKGDLKAAQLAFDEAILLEPEFTAAINAIQLLGDI